MSFVIAVPEFVAAAATDLADIGSTIGSANAAVMAPTTGVLGAGADEVSAAIAAMFRMLARLTRRSVRKRRRSTTSLCS